MPNDHRDSAESRLWEAIQKKRAGTPGSSDSSSPAPAPQPKPSKKPVVKQKVKLEGKAATNYLASALVVEPNKRISLNMVNLLKSMKIRADSVATGEDAQKLLQSSKYLIIIIEKNLPDIAGFNLSTKLRTMDNGRNAVIIITSEERDPSMKDQALMVDADDYLPKPIHTAELTETVKFHLLERKKQG